MIVGCVLSLVGTGVVWGYLKHTNGQWNNITAVDSSDRNIRNIGAQSGDQNYLIVGTDTRSGMNGDVGAGTTADAGGARSDTVILVNIPASRSRVVAVSFPRDLQIDRPSCQSWNNDTGTYDPTTVVPAETGAKLNTAYGFGGPKCAVQVLTKMTGLNINHFIAMDFYGFEQVVNKIGGVRVCSTTPLYDYELGNILSRPGSYTLRGPRALNYVRARTIETEGNGDYGRIKRQQLFLSSMLRSLLSGNVLSNPSKLNGIISTFIKYSKVDNISTDNLLDLAQSMQGLQAGRVTFLTIPTAGTTTDGANNEIPRTDDINAIFNAIIDDQPLPGEAELKKTDDSTKKKRPTPAPSSAPKSTDTASTDQTPVEVTATAQSSGDVGVRVLNGTGGVGVATGVSNVMSNDGFDVRGVADASELYPSTVVRYGPGQEDAAATVAAMFADATIQPDDNVKSGVEVIVGKDYKDDLRSAPTPGGSLTAAKLPQSNEHSALPDDLSVTNAADTTCQ
ncbi:hypothetical protein GCM10027169_29910 [Gordonia jinhuaensis]|uniref:LytR family transcriptional regulator n=2 Tax=Gordonia jinhuaensis TaxID=1517702 RepID=A0A916WUV4_9ACTN|nr:hypothetical protein GCM10011489_20950 [Gordonia jinhuaensis]